MNIQLPRWMILELEKDMDKSIQSLIKEIVREYIDSKEGGEIRRRVGRNSRSNREEVRIGEKKVGE